MECWVCATSWVFGALGCAILFKLVNYATMGVYKGKERLDGKTAIITGANSGCGLETAKDFSRRGARVIMVCRNIQKAEAARQEIISASGNSNIIIKSMDLNSLETVRKCVQELIEEEKRIDILVNNAGVADMFGESVDGLEIMMQGNYFGPFLFTNLLIGKMKESAPSRIVNVSSKNYVIGSIDLKHMKKTNRSNLMMLYSDTKLAMNYFSWELAQKLKGTGVTSNSLHPGVFASNFFKDPSIITRIYLQFVRMFFKTCEQGAQTSIYLSVSPKVADISGEYFEDCKQCKMWRKIDADLSKKLWKFTEEIVGLKLNERHY